MGTSDDRVLLFVASHLFDYHKISAKCHRPVGSLLQSARNHHSVSGVGRRHFCCVFGGVIFLDAPVGPEPACEIGSTFSEISRKRFFHETSPPLSLACSDWIGAS